VDVEVFVEDVGVVVPVGLVELLAVVTVIRLLRAASLNPSLSRYRT
jgi:hypothetical protein